MTNTVRRLSMPGDLRCSFTGYRPHKMPFGYSEDDPRCIDFKKQIKDTIRVLYDRGYRHFLSGGAMGMDMYAAKAVIELRKEHPDIILEIHIRMPVILPKEAASDWLNVRYDAADVLRATRLDVAYGMA